MTPVAATLSLYLARVFTLAVLAMLAALSGLVSLFDFIELLRRAATKPDVGFALILEIAALRLPWIAMEVLPFAVLLGAILAFWRLTRSSELIVARAAGVSAWQFLAAPTMCAVALGGIATGVISPISALMRGRAEQLDSAYLRTGGGPLSLSGGQIWLRQTDMGANVGDVAGEAEEAREHSSGVAILHANSVRIEDGVLGGAEVSVFRLTPDDRLAARIEAPTMRLEPGSWVLQQARVITPGHLPQPARDIDLPTDFTLARVQESFASPDTLSVWALPGFIATLEHAGFSSVRHRLHFQALLALPLLAGTMCLLGAGFSMRPTRRGGVAQMIGSGVAAGFALFVVSKVAEEFGQSGALPATLAAWAPAAAGALLAVALLLHLEDG